MTVAVCSQTVAMLGGATQIVTGAVRLPNPPKKFSRRFRLNGGREKI